MDPSIEEIKTEKCLFIRSCINMCFENVVNSSSGHIPVDKYFDIIESLLPIT